MNPNASLRNIRLGYKLDGDVNAYTGPSNLILVGPPRRGKLTTIIAPIGFTYAGSLLSFDPKGQAPCVFGAHRLYNMGQDSYRIDPFNQHAGYLDFIPRVGFNPSADLSPDDPEFVEKLNRLSNGLIPRSKQGGSDNAAYFIQSARGLTAGLIGGVILLCPENERHLVTVFDKLADPEKFFPFVERCVGTGDDFLVSSLARYRHVSTRDSKEVEGILATARVELSFMSGRAVRECLSSPSAFRWRDLKKRPTTVYYTVKLSHAETCEKLSRLLVGSMLNELEQPEPDSVPLLAICDEYKSTLSNMELMTDALSYSAGLGIQFMPIWQDLPQVATTSKNWQTMLGTCGGAQIFLRPAETFSANYISEALGESEVIATSKTVSYPADTDWENAGQVRPQVTENRSQVTRRLMLPQDVLKLPDQEMVIMAENVPEPFKALRRDYRETPEFKGLYGPDPFHPDPNVKGPEPRWNKAVKSFVFGKGHRNTGGGA